MDFLYYLEALRTPLLNKIFSFMTHFGEEIVVIALALLIFWCIDKYEGYFLMAVSFFGIIVNQTLKMIFRIPRPWVIDKNFSIVESARAEATGYSFPSGHTQIATGLYGGVARWNKNLAVRIIFSVIILIIAFSRMYLGVHTPMDVGVSLLVGIVLVFAFYPIFKKGKDNPKIITILFGVLTLLTIGAMIFLYTYSFPADTDMTELSDAQGNVCKLLGAILGMCLVFFLDTKYIKFKTEAPLIGQILKYVIGLALVIGLRTALKAGFGAIMSGSPVADILRYFIMIGFAGAVWPLTFPIFAKIGRKKQNGGAE